MSVLPKKTRSFLITRKELNAQYIQIKARAESNAEFDPELIQGLKNLHDFDQLCYSFCALKAYYDVSKSRWDLDYRNLLDDLQSLNNRVEAKLPVSELVVQFGELAVLRRQLKENAREGGKVAHLMVSLKTEMGKLVASLALALSVQHAAVEDTTKTAESDAKSIAKGSAAQKPKSKATKAKDARAVVIDSSAGTTPSLSETPVELPASTPSKPPSNKLPTPQVPKHIPTSTKRSAPSDFTLQPAKPLQLPQTQSMMMEEARTFPADDLSFWHFKLWTRQHVHCMFQAFFTNETEPSQEIRTAFRQHFQVEISLVAAQTLLLHYGLSPQTDNFQYYIQVFHLVASQFYENRKKYVTVPWADLRVQFSRKTGILLPDWEIRGRYQFFLLQRRTYGVHGEPLSNYIDFVEQFRRRAENTTLQEFSSLPHDNSNWKAHQEAIPNQGTGPSSPLAYPQQMSLADYANRVPNALDYVAEAHHKIPHNTPNRLLAIQHYVRLKAGADVPTKRMEDILRNQDVEQPVRNSPEADGSFLTNPEPTTKAENSSPQLLTEEITPPVPKTPVMKARTHAVVSPDIVSPVVVSPIVASPDYGVEEIREIHQLPLKLNTPTSPKSLGTIPHGSKLESSPKSPRKQGHFEKLMDQIETHTRPDWHYRRLFRRLALTDFWTFEKSKCICATVEYISRIPADTRDVTLRVARLNLMVLLRLRLLRHFKVKLLPELIESRMMRMMEEDAFDAELCRTINEHFLKK